MKKINWGIIGCGDVTEIKSGPALYKTDRSSLIAVMRRDAVKAKDYAHRHNVPRWYDDANKLIHDDDINAIYIATPPSTHEEFAMAAINAGKNVYLEKPMALDAASAKRIVEAANNKKIKLVIAHYRRAQPFFKKIKQLLDEKIIGEVKFASLAFYKRSFSKYDLQITKNAWRVNAAIAGGGLFHDLAPHQLDLMLYYFGDANIAAGYSINQERSYSADDIVAGNIVFNCGVLFNGIWCFTVDQSGEKDSCEIVGTKGKITFSVFGEHTITISLDEKTETFTFDIPAHVQQPMIEKVVAHFLNDGPNPCSGEVGVKVMQLIEAFTQNNSTEMGNKF
ncbi:MAG: Gfo/Idh/MocA family oxidoreductase [Chitinophagaceae bacterium]|nr:Gfo/Idh/MocA family oxidoreductase [Chitinophagaceae bacterium]